ncbi:hypothetical protein [Erwinia sp. OPT-41]|uniref:Uncharacterized protein n=1 Tax=Erwinia plantamica TaxID=3237104 RepID=A0ABW7CKW5_9GAMM
MKFSLLRGCFLSLARLFFLWPALLIGSVVLVMGFQQYHGGIVSRVEHYAYEATRWRNAPEGHLIVQQCNAAEIFPVAELSFRAKLEFDCTDASETFERMAEKDISRLRLVIKIVLLISFCIELAVTVRARIRIVRGADNE